MARSKQPTERGALILQRLEERSMSIAEVTRRTPLTKNTILNVIYGPREPQRKTIEILAETLELPIGALTQPASEDSVLVTPDSAPSFWPWLLRWNHPALWVSLVGAFVTAFLLNREDPQTALVQSAPSSRFARSIGAFAEILAASRCPSARFPWSTLGLEGQPGSASALGHGLAALVLSLRQSGGR